MSFIKKAGIVFFGYAIYQLLINERYEDLRKLINEKYDEIKPHILEFINNADSYVKFPTSIEKERSQLNIEKRLEFLKNEIDKINTNKISNFTSSLIIETKNSIDKIKEKIDSKSKD